MTNNIITLDNVSFAYARANRWALQNNSVEIGEGDFIAVMGANGAGKTTFCRLLNGLIPHSLAGKLLGTVTVDGLQTASVSAARLAGKTGMAFDDPEVQLFTAKVSDEVSFALENLLMPPEEIKKKVQWALDAAGLAAYAGYAPSALSGGQKQRLAIAAAVAMADKVLVLDEPTSQLDPRGAGEVLSFIRDLRARRRLTVVMATNCGDEVAEFADKIIVLKDGRLAAYDTPYRVFADGTLLADNTLQCPQVSELARRMAFLGKPLPSFPITIHEAEKSVVNWYGKY
ncbi:MAG: ATP-binding cassette domain-containing protein [Treponema sp.]|nr:ATP-binding cassette domain-containing protein [Treponema sp.]